MENVMVPPQMVHVELDDLPRIRHRREHSRIQARRAPSQGRAVHVGVDGGQFRVLSKLGAVATPVRITRPAAAAPGEGFDAPHALRVLFLGRTMSLGRECFGAVLGGHQAQEGGRGSCLGGGTVTHGRLLGLGCGRAIFKQLDAIPKFAAHEPVVLVAPRETQ